MHNRRKFWYKTSNKIILAFIALLGFSSCRNIDDDDDDMYGVPSADYIINGKIKSAHTDEAIAGIMVKATDSRYSNTDSLYTDENGNFTLEYRGHYPTYGFNINFESIDIDDSLNGGLFEAKDTIVEFIDPVFTGGDGSWDQGEAVEDIEIKLNLENNED